MLHHHRVSVALLILLVVSNIPAHQLSQSGSAGPAAQVLVTISENTGDAVPAVTKESVELWVGGRRVEIRNIHCLKDAPLFFSVLVDLSGSTREFSDQQNAAASKLFESFSTGSDHGYLVLFASVVRTDDHFVDAAAAQAILRRFPERSRSGPTALYDAVAYAATAQLASTKIPRNSRRAILVLSDGGDDSSRKSLEETLRIVDKQGIPIFAVGFSQPPNSDSAVESKEALEHLSDGTGGVVRFVSPFHNPAEAVTHIVELTDSQCLLTFERPPLKPQRFYSLKVKSSVKGIRVLAAREYFLP